MVSKILWRASQIVRFRIFEDEYNMNIDRFGVFEDEYNIDRLSIEFEWTD